MNGGSAGQPMTTPPIRSRRGNLEHPQEQEQFTKALGHGQILTVFLICHPATTVVAAKDIPLHPIT